MLRWITKILLHSKKVKNKIKGYFDEYKPEAPELDCMSCAKTTIEVLDRLKTLSADITEEETQKMAQYTNDKLVDEIINNMKKYKPSTFENEFGQLADYKKAVNSIKSYGDGVVNFINPSGNVVITLLIRGCLSFIKKVIRCVQARATFAAKLILKAMKLAGKKDPSITQDDIEKMNKDINEARDELDDE